MESTDGPLAAYACARLIQKSTTASGVLEYVVTAVQEITGFGRVVAYRLDPGGAASLMAENHGSELRSSFSPAVPEPLVFPQTKPCGAGRRLQHIADVNAVPTAPVSPRESPADEAQDLDSVAIPGVSPSQIASLQKLGVGAWMSLSLFVHDERWGLVVCNHDEPLHLDPSQCVACEVLSGIASDRISVLQHRVESCAAEAAKSALDRRATIQRSQISLADALQETEDAVILVDRTGKVELWGDGAERLYGYSRESALGMQLDQLAPSPLSSDLSRIAELIERREPLKSFESRRRHQDGRLLDVWVTAAIVRHEGVNSGIALIERDITASKRAVRLLKEQQAELQRVNQELDQFSYVASHELKSPLVTIKGFLYIVKKAIDEGDMETGRKAFQRITDAADRMADLLSGLLELSRIGRVVAADTIVALDDVVRQAIVTCQGALDASGAEVSVAANLPVVRGDRMRLEEVFVNLLDNATKFRRDDRVLRIEIGSERRKEHYLVSVRDNGRGIAEDHAEKIFEIFEKLPSDRAGSGIGLALVRKITEAHGGRVWAESAGVGCGSTFWFEFPATA